jgi:hypothetical protein
MPIEMAKALRIKGMIDGALAATPEDSPHAALGLVDTYNRLRLVCADLVKGTEAEPEFDGLYPQLPAVSDSTALSARASSIAGDRARVVLGGLAGWLAAWPSAEQLLDELVAALEEAEAGATEPEQKARLAGVLEGLRGAGREIAVGVVTAYLTRVHV